MVTPLKRFWQRWTGGSKTAQPEKVSKVEFRLLFGRTTVGTLIFDSGKWKYHYSEEFKRKEDFRPIVQFPDKEKDYESDELWPFFAMRIPSPKQPAIQRIMAEENIDEADRVHLLKRFGKRTISNPFVLTDG